MKQTELALQEDDFRYFAMLLQNEFGISLRHIHRETLEKRLISRLRELKLKSFSQYREHLLESVSLSRELHLLPARLLNMESYFLREKPQFDLFSSLLTQVQTGKGRGKDRKIRILSAGCSSGQEPYSIAIVIKESGITPAGRLPAITGVDIDASALEKARHGIYHAYALRGVGNSIINRHMQKISRDYYRLKEEILRSVTFSEANLLCPDPIAEGEFDFIFCRNVLLYMSRAAAARITENLWKSLADGGYLFLGQSEVLPAPGTSFIPVKYPDVTVYRKKTA